MKENGSAFRRQSFDWITMRLHGINCRINDSVVIDTDHKFSYKSAQYIYQRMYIDIYGYDLTEEGRENKLKTMLSTESISQGYKRFFVSEYDLDKDQLQEKNTPLQNLTIKYLNSNDANVKKKSWVRIHEFLKEMIRQKQTATITKSLIRSECAVSGATLNAYTDAINIKLD